MKLTAYQQLVSGQQTCMTYTICCVYSAKLLMMDRGTVRNMESFIPNKCEKLVHLVGFIITKVPTLVLPFHIIAAQPDDGRNYRPKHVAVNVINK